MRKVTVRLLCGKASAATTGYSGVGHPPNTSTLMCQVRAMDHSILHVAHTWQGEWDAWTHYAFETIVKPFIKGRQTIVVTLARPKAMKILLLHHT